MVFEAAEAGSPEVSCRRVNCGSEGDVVIVKRMVGRLPSACVSIFLLDSKFHM